MDTLDLILLGMVIASNNLSFSFGMGALGTTKYHLRIIAIFSVVEFTIPLIGLFTGRYLKTFVDQYAALTAGLILVGLGIYTIVAAIKSKRQKKEMINKIMSYKGVLLIALGLSIDNLVVGFSLGLGDVNPLKLAAFIGFSSMLFTFIGLKTGKFIKDSMSRYVEIFAGMILILMGVVNYFDWF